MLSSPYIFCGLKNALDFRLDARPIGIHDLTAGMNDNFVAVRQVAPVAANRFPEPALDLVPNNSLPNGSRYGQADAAWFRFAHVPNEHRKQRTSDTAALLIDPLKFRSFSKTPGLGETLRISGFGLSIIRS